jgi:iron(III) transport system ATP-binding protein
MSDTTKKPAAAVEFRSVTKRYGSVTAVDAVSFTIEPGMLVTLLGPSGCGKTTTLRLIAGLETASSGSITIGGRDVTRLSAADRDVSMVFQSYALFPHMTVLENASYGPSVSGIPKARAEAMAAEKLALVGLTGLEKRLPSELSGGQQQRVAVARALVLEPQVLLFDEPLSNLDAKLRRRVREDIRDLQQRLGLTVAYVTHDQQEALAVSDRVIVMSNARIAQNGRPRELYEMPANSFVADFIGDSNQVDAVIVAVMGECARVRIGVVEMELASRGRRPGATRLAIRPEAISLSAQRGEGQALACRVEKASYLGSHMEYSLESPVGPLFVIDRNVSDPHAPGATIWAAFGVGGVLVIPE